MHWAFKMRWAFKTVSLVLFGGCAAMAHAASPEWNGDGGVSAFYAAALPEGARPGAFIAREQMSETVALPAASESWRILYVSSDWKDGHPITVSGAVFLPRGRMPEGGWPVIAWAHGTTGVADVCAPSFRPRTPRDTSYLSGWLKAGYAIVATDYPGLGTPGPHPYLLYRPEGLSVLDSVRAALAEWPTELRNRVIAVGQSQGSGAVLGAGYLWPAYAGDVGLKGIVATGIVAQIEDVGGAPQIHSDAEYNDASYVDAAFAMLHFLGTERSIDPTLDPEKEVTPAGRSLMQSALHGCMKDAVRTAERDHDTARVAFRGDTEERNRFEARYGRFPTARIHVPVFVGTGLADGEAGTVDQYNFISAMCRQHVAVTWHYYPHATHSSAMTHALPDALSFGARLMDGKKSDDLCASFVPPGPVQVAEPE